ncbi:MAG: NAD(P)/FAD-dependent oxidoreductase [Candidatus Nanopelagicaceae bacterium]|nr:NAD(P)/FAD-dependent oxidoreductase [Candidatus Nanopelagicaceae bacterium]
MNLDYDAIIVGSGHNGLVAACYLAKAGKRVLVLEKNDYVGGATTSISPFKGIDAQLSRYSYLVALLPDQIITDLSLNFECLSRAVSTYAPYFDETDQGLLINRIFDQESHESMELLTGGREEAQAWINFYSSVQEFAGVLAPTFLQPLPTAAEVQEMVDPLTWVELVENTLGQTLHDNFYDDLVKGIVLTDGLIGTFTNAESHAANICFLYHLVGNGNGEWKVPKGGMGALVAELKRRCQELGVEIKTETEVVSVNEGADAIEIETKEGESFASQVLLANCAPKVLEKIAGIPAPEFLDGSQLKINMVLRELPKLKSGADPRKAFAGTFRINESFHQLERAYEQALQGKIPDEIPAEMYCHTITDPSIMAPSLINEGFHTLTLFALHLPAFLFDDDHDEVKELALTKVLESLNEYLEKPIQDYLAVDSEGNLCIEAKTPQELEIALGLPRGNIFHGNLQFPWKTDGDSRKWGVETKSKRIFIAGSGAVRGGGVSGIAGHNAAMAALESLAQLA